MFRYKISIILLFFSTFLTVIVGIYVWPETYMARAELLIKLGRENIEIPAGARTSSQQQVVSTGVRREDINSEIEIQRSKVVIERAVQKLGLDFLFPEAIKPKSLLKRIKYEFGRAASKVKNFIFEILYRLDLKKRLSPHDEAVLKIQKKLSVEPIRNSDVIEVQLRWFNPDIAREILNSLIAYQLDYHLEIHKTSGGHEFFEKQVKIVGKQLKDFEDRLQLLKQKQGITSYDEQRGLLLHQIDRFQASLKQTETELVETTANIDGLNSQLSAITTHIPTGFALVYKEAGKNLLLEEVHFKSLIAKKKKQQEHIESYIKELESINVHTNELKRLERQIQISEESYILYRRKLEEARITDVLDADRIVNVKVIDPAATSGKPVKPKKLLMLGLGIVLGLIMGIGFAFLSEYLDQSVRTAEHIKQHLNLPLLASIRETKRRPT